MEYQAPLNPLVTISTERNSYRCLWFDGQHSGSRYERYDALTEYTGTSANIIVRKMGTGEGGEGGGKTYPLDHDSYTLLINDTPAATATGMQGKTSFTFANVDLTPFPNKTWLKFKIPTTLPEDNFEWWAFYNRDNEFIENSPLMPTFYGSHALAGATTHRWAFLPPRFTPAPVPLPRREYPEFSTYATPAGMFRQNIVMPIQTVRRPNITTKGLWTTMNEEAYRYSQMFEKKPSLHMLDGPRGVGTLSFPMHIQIDRRGGYHVLTPWSLVHVSEEGTITTRAGMRSRTPPSNWGKEHYPAPLEVEYVGDWSEIEAAGKPIGFHEMWGLAFDERTLAIDSSKPLIGPPANRSGWEHPHTGLGPVAFIADTQHNRVLKLQFKATDHSPPKITIFIENIADPWDVVYGLDPISGKHVIFVSVRFEHRIAAYDATTGEFVRDVVKATGSPPVYAINSDRKAGHWVRVGGGEATSTYIASLRAYDTVYPEGLVLQDGWLYYGSATQGEIRRKNLTTGEVLLCGRPYQTDNTLFHKLAVSDGTFGPRGTVFAATWNITSSGGYPEAFKPDGTRWTWVQFAAASTYPYIEGRGGKYNSNSYPSAVAVGKGRIVWGAASEGLFCISRAVATDPTPNITKYRAGRDKWNDQFALSHGGKGYGYYGFPLPWGVDPDIDYYLEFVGHSRNKLHGTANIWVSP